LNKANVMQLCR